MHRVELGQPKFLRQRTAAAGTQRHTPSRKTRLERSDVVRSILPYAVGTISLVLLDLYLGQTMPSRDLADWAQFKSQVFLGASLLLLGMDQALLRVDIPPGKFVPTLLRRSAIAVGLLLVVDRLTLGGVLDPLALIASPFLAICLALGGFLRARYWVSGSQSVIHLWKLLLIGALLGFALSLGHVSSIQARIATTALLALWASAVWLIVSHRFRGSHQGNGDADFRVAREIGRRFWILSIAANGIMYLDQILLGVTNDAQASATFFLYSSVVLPLPAFAAGFIANVVNPYLRSEGNAARGRLRRLQLLLSLTGAFTSAAGVVGIVVLNRTTDRFSGQLTWWIVVSLAATAAVRFLYVVPSGVVGVFGTYRDLDDLAHSGIASLVWFAASFAAAHAAYGQPLPAISFSLLSTVALRYALAARIARRLLAREGVLKSSLGSPTSEQQSLLFIAPLPFLERRTRLIKFAVRYQNDGFRLKHLAWERESSEQLAANVDRIEVKRSVLLSGGGYGGRRLAPFYLLWTFRVFLRLRREPCIRVHALGLESALPVAIWKRLGKQVFLVYDDADRFSLCHPMPDVLRASIARAERWVAQTADMHIVPGPARYDDGLPCRATVMLPNSPEKSSLERSMALDIPNFDRATFVLYVNGWLSPSRGIFVALALARAFSNDERFHIIAAGRVTGFAVEELAECRNVTYLGEVSNVQALAYYRAADMVLTMYDPTSRINQFAEANKWGDALATRTAILVNSEVKTAAPYLAAGVAFGVGFDDHDGAVCLVRQFLDQEIDPAEGFTGNAWCTLVGKPFDQVVDEEILPQFGGRSE